MAKIGNAHVIEIANRVATNNAADGISGVANNLANHQSGLNTNAHQISNISGLQTVLNGKEPVFSKNTAFNKNFGTTSGTVCQGNDSRLSDARTPTTHTHTISDVSGLQTELNGKQDVINGYTGNVSVVVGVDFTAETVTTVEIKIVNGIITEIN